MINYSLDIYCDRNSYVLAQYSIVINQERDNDE